MTRPRSINRTVNISRRPGTLAPSAVLLLVLASLTACSDDIRDVPSESSAPVVESTVITDTSVEFRDPTVPVSGGEGLPETDLTPGEEVDCENAEELCDSGDWACDDIADYCDIGPDGGELPDDWDWDQ